MTQEANCISCSSAARCRAVPAWETEMFLFENLLRGAGDIALG